MNTIDRMTDEQKRSLAAATLDWLRGDAEGSKSVRDTFQERVEPLIKSARRPEDVAVWAVVDGDRFATVSASLWHHGRIMVLPVRGARVNMRDVFTVVGTGLYDWLATMIERDNHDSHFQATDDRLRACLIAQANLLSASELGMGVGFLVGCYLVVGIGPVYRADGRPPIMSLNVVPIVRA